MTLPDPASSAGGARPAGTWVAVGLHVAVGVFPLSATGLLAPAWGFVVVYVWWLALFAVVWRWRPRVSWAALIVPVVAVGGWFAIMSAGEALFGWTA